jgi:hypothetical protein
MSQTIIRIHDFFSNFCVFETDGITPQTFIYSNELDAKKKRYELDLKNINIIGNTYDKYKNNVISLKEYDNKFDKFIITTTDIFRVCKFMNPEKQKLVCMKKGNKFYNS